MAGTDGPAVRLTISNPWLRSDIALGTSIAHAGCCLTVVDWGDHWHAVEVSGETRAVTTLSGWAIGTRVNLERSLKLGDEMGGHMVSGHVDGIGILRHKTYADGYTHLTFEAPLSLARFIAAKGSITVDGVSLTVNRVLGSQFDVAIIPHTAAVTTLGALAVGQGVNLEVDLVARYIARQLEYRS